MSIVFAASEASGLDIAGTAAEDTATTAARRTSNSRASIGSPDGTALITATLDTALTECWIHGLAYSGAWDNDQNAYLLRVKDSSGNNVFQIYTNSPGVFFAQYWNGSAWVTVGSSWTITSGQTSYAIYLKTGASGTSCIVLTNGTIVASGSIGTATVNVKTLVWGTPDNNLAGYFSEIAVDNANLSLVGCYVETEAPTGAGGDATGTGAYTDVDEAVINDADVITFGAAGDRNSFTSPARTSTLSLVRGVGVAARAKRDASGPQKMKFYLKIGGTRYYSPDITLTTGFAAYQYVWATNPSTSAAWTSTDANAAGLEWGIEAVA
ncbi:hypothetical protein [Sphingobium sp. MI1205]|uniref:hypothetical protein n=1 Tax=Sphingobium sp. MI1205 TaxID=407020 RepID=UPI00076FF50A|nr:hypothetical protein [Sphingobium sp. MI1205]AMK19324.1 hypothetical protein K663_14730 [Sphingobium sp. MI1205]